MARAVTVEIIGDAKKYKRATDEAVSATGRFDQKLKSFTSKDGIIGAMLGGLGVGAGLGVFSLVKDAIGGVVGALGDAVAAAKEDEAAAARLNATLQANVKGWDGNTAAIEGSIAAGARLAFTDDDIREGLNSLIPRTQDVNEALRLNALAMDLARAKGMSLGDAAGLIGKAYSGQTSALRRAGIAISANMKPTEALAQLQRQVADQAKTYAATAAGSAEAVQIQISEAMETIGYALTPVVSALMSFAADTIPMVITSLGNLGDAFNNLHRWMDPGLALVQDQNASLVEYAATVGMNSEALLAFVEAQRAETKAAEAATVQKQLSTAALEDYRRELEAANAANEGSLYTEEEITRLVQEMADGYRALTPAVKESAEVDAFAAKAAEDYKAALAGVVAGWSELGKTQGPERMMKVATFMADNARLIKIIFADLPPALQQAMRDAGLVVTEGAAVISEGLAQSGEGVAAAVKADLSPLTGIVRGTLKRAKAAALAGMADLNWALKHPMAEARLERFYQHELNVAYRKLHKAQQTGNVLAIAKAQTLVDDLKAKLNELRSVRINIQTTLNQPITHRPQPDEYRPNRNQYVPRAGGGPVGRGRAYIVGEQRAELFVPDQNGTIVPSVAGGGLGGNSYTINVNAGIGDPASIGREVVSAIRAFEQRAGRSWRTA